jgi:IPT/TIG domain
VFLPAKRASTSSASTAPAVTAVAASTASNPTLQLVAGFTGMTVQKQTTDFSANSDQNVAPPDTQLAAGPNNLLEEVNSTGSVWNKDGTFVTDFDLNAFYGLLGGSYTFSDPRVLYDALSGRWFSTGVAYTSSYASEFVLAVSTSGDPAGTWKIYAAAQSSLLHDQPKLGVSTDKVAIAWNDFLSGSFFEGATTWVLQKSPLLTGSPAPGTAIGPNSNQSGILPAQHLADSSALYLVYNNSDCGYTGCNTGSPSIGVITAGGTPGTGSFTWSESDPGIAGTTNPPNADQPQMLASIDTNDDRFLNSVWLNGVLWTGGNDACTPPSDTAVRPCSRLIQVLTGTMTVNQNFDLARLGGDLYYPVAWLAANGDMFVGYNFSSSVDYVGFRVAGQPAGSSPQTIIGAQTVQAGLALYNLSQCFPTYSGPDRWGDYGGGAFDPGSTGDVWVAGEYAGSNASFPNCDWATYAQRLNFQTAAAPTVTGVNPNSCPDIGCSTSVTVTGTGFVSGSTSVAFGAAAGTNVSVGSATRLTVTAPMGCGLVDVTVTSPSGTSASSAADQFTYTASGPQICNLSPSSGPAAGGQGFTVSGSGFQPGATSVAFNGVAATGVSCTSTSCTGTTPPGVGGRATVTVIAGTITSNTAVYTYIPSLGSIVPSSGTYRGGTTVTISGAGFAAGAVQFYFGGNAATSVNCTSQTSCTAVTPAGTAGATVSVTVMVNGTSGSNSLSYTYTHRKT